MLPNARSKGSEETQLERARSTLAAPHPLRPVSEPSTQVAHLALSLAMELSFLSPKCLPHVMHDDTSQEATTKRDSEEYGSEQPRIAVEYVYLSHWARATIVSRSSSSTARAATGRYSRYRAQGREQWQGVMQHTRIRGRGEAISTVPPPSSFVSPAVRGI